MKKDLEEAVLDAVEPVAEVPVELVIEPKNKNPKKFNKNDINLFNIIFI